MLANFNLENFLSDSKCFLNSGFKYFLQAP